MIERVRQLEQQIEVYPTFVRKEIERRQFLGALGHYHRYVLEPLVEVLRLKHSPTKRNFYLKDVISDLPARLVPDLERYSRVHDLGDLEQLLPEALELMRETLGVLKDQWHSPYERDVPSS